MSHASGLAGIVADMAGAEILENSLAAAQALLNATNDLSSSNEAEIRGVICADGRRQIALFNAPKSRKVHLFGTSVDQYHGGWLKSNPGGSTGLIDSTYILHED